MCVCVCGLVGVYACVCVCGHVYVIEGAVMTIPISCTAGLTFQSDDEGQFQLKVLTRLDNPIGYRLTVHNASEDVHKNTLHLKYQQETCLTLYIKRKSQSV